MPSDSLLNTSRFDRTALKLCLVPLGQATPFNHGFPNGEPVFHVGLNA